MIEKGLRQDVQTVRADGEPVAPLIDGVLIRHQVTQIDERGTLCEILDPRWEVAESPIVYVYQFTIRPGKAKGWHVHRLHDDRIFISQGEIKVVLYDDRADPAVRRRSKRAARALRDRGGGGERAADHLERLLAP